MMNTAESVPVLAQLKRKFLPADFTIAGWENIEPFYKKLVAAQINSPEDLRQWLLDRSELESTLQEDVGWRYIRMTCDTTNKEFNDAFNFYVAEIEPKVAPYNNELNLKFLNSSFSAEFENTDYNNYLKSVRRQVEIYREENIPLIAEIQQKQQLYGATVAAMTVEVDSKELTLQQAAVYLKNIDRNKRREVYEKIIVRRQQDKDNLDNLYTELIQLRNKVALNAGFKNYRDYMFAALCRFDYGVDDCIQFHNSIAQEIVPLCNQLNVQRKEKLDYPSLKPYDLEVDITGKPALHPFKNSEEMIEKTSACFNSIDKEVYDSFLLLKNLNRLDLESRKGKAPGGYNYPLYETGVPFIFMNSTGLLRDLVTLVHEGGHAVHAVLSHNLEFSEFKNCPSEVAELASMSMELISMEHWNTFFDNEEELNRAKSEHLQDVIEVLPWIATIDKFQHWVYTNPDHTIEEREKNWLRIYEEFAGTVTDWSGYEGAKAALWQKQLHLFEVPFYYIEYGMAQLGAIALWKNYRKNPQQAIDDYKSALRLGYTRTIHEIYNTAGVKFDFSKEYILELARFVKQEMAKFE